MKSLESRKVYIGEWIGKVGEEKVQSGLRGVGKDLWGGYHTNQPALVSETLSPMPECPVNRRPKGA